MAISKLPHRLHSLRARLNPDLRSSLHQGNQFHLLIRNSCQNLRQLTELDLSNQGLQCHDIGQLNHVLTIQLTKMTILQCLNLSGSRFLSPNNANAADIVSELFHAFDSLYQLQRLVLRETGVLHALTGISAVAGVATGAAARPKMFYEYLSRVLNLSSCKLSFLVPKSATASLSSTLKNIVYGMGVGARLESSGLVRVVDSVTSGDQGTTRMPQAATETVSILQNLEELDLSNNCFKDEELSELVQSFWQRKIAPDSKAWREAVYTGSALGNLKSIGYVFKSLPAMRYVNLTDNVFTVSGAGLVLESMTGVRIAARVEGPEEDMKGKVVQRVGMSCEDSRIADSTFVGAGGLGMSGPSISQCKAKMIVACRLKGARRQDSTAVPGRTVRRCGR